MGDVSNWIWIAPVGLIIVMVGIGIIIGIDRRRRGTSTDSNWYGGSPGSSDDDRSGTPRAR